MKKVKKISKKMLILIIAVTMLLSVLSACGGKGGSGSDEPTVVGIAMPTYSYPIWRLFGEKLQTDFEAAGYTVILEYAENVVERQISQIENMLMQGAKYIIVSSVDTFAMTEICRRAKESDAVVIANDRLIMRTDDIDWYVAFDLVRNGELMGEAVERALGLADGNGPFNMEIFSGSSDDSNAILFYTGQMNILQKYIDSGQLVIPSGQVSFEVTSIFQWDSATAQDRMDNLLGAFYNDIQLDVALAAADILALGVISSLESFGYGDGGHKFPVITGQDSELPSVNAILAGKQTMTVFLDPKDNSALNLRLVNALEAGETLTPDAHYNNETFDVPALLYDPVSIDINNYQMLIDAGIIDEADLVYP